MPTYVLDNIEVCMTGRVAYKQRQGSRRGTPSTDKKVEVTPIDQNNGDWKKWVVMDELYTVEEDKAAATQEEKSSIDLDDACREEIEKASEEAPEYVKML